MKIFYFIFTLFLSQAVLSQVVWLSSDEPGLNDSAFYYRCDSTVSNYSSIKGTGSNWDYSNIPAYSFDVGRKAKADDANLKPYANFYLNASHDQFIEEHIHTFYELNTVQRTAYGIQFNEDNLGDVLATYDGIKDRSYPWSFQSMETGALSNCEIVAYPNSTSPAQETHPADGSFSYECDAVGDITIGDSVISDVLRNFRYDSIQGDFGILGKVTFIRKQYEYYKPGTSFPVFIHSYVKASGALLSTEYNLVLSLVQPRFIVGIDDRKLESIQMNIFPNPTNSEITISKSDLTLIKDIRVHDLSGKEISVKVSSSTDAINIDMSKLKDGVYFVLITMSDGKTYSEKILKTGKN